jgi:c-di-GMP-binding flagellar brake protein YcgR
MIERFVKPGDKLEIIHGVEKNNRIAYVSQVEDIFGDNKLKIAAPIAEGKIVPLSIDKKYKLVIYADKGLYETTMKVTQRITSGIMNYLKIDLLSKLEKVQRREYFRFNCIIPFTFKKVNDEGCATEGVVKDISGGGLKFITNGQLRSHEYIETYVPLHDNHIQCIGIVLYANKSNAEMFKNEYRIEFTKIADSAREKIIKYTFDEQRRWLQKDKE